MKDKIGIVLPFQNGDLITATSVLRYKDELWSNSDIVWFCNDPHRELLKYQDLELRYFPHGWGILENDLEGVYSERVKKDKEEGRPEWQDWSVLMNAENKLNQELKYKFAAICDLTEVYFPAPWMLTPKQRHGISYPDCSKKVFDIPMDWEWHPVLMFSDEERRKAMIFADSMKYPKTIAVETFAGSGQSKLNHEMVKQVIQICRNILGQCNFVFVSHKYLNGNESFPAEFVHEENIYSASTFTVRQCALVVERCDLLVSVSSGITVASSAWGLATPPILQYTGSWVCSTASLAKGRYFELVTHDEKIPQMAEAEFFLRLEAILNNIK